MKKNQILGRTDFKLPVKKRPGSLIMSGFLVFLDLLYKHFVFGPAPLSIFQVKSDCFDRLGGRFDHGVGVGSGCCSRMYRSLPSSGFNNIVSIL